MRFAVLPYYRRFGEFCKTCEKKLWYQLLSFERRLCGYIHKSIGLNLRKYKRKRKEKLSDGGTVGGQGKLTEVVIDTFQNYYGAAIRNDRRSEHKM